MKTTSKDIRKGVFQTVDDGARVAHMDAAVPRPTVDKKAKHRAPHGDGRIAGRAPVLTHEHIAERARAIWIERGRIAGEDDRNWHEAEAQLRREVGLEHPSL